MYNYKSVFPPEAVDIALLSQVIGAGALELPGSLDQQVSFTRDTHPMLRYVAAKSYLQIAQPLRGFLAQSGASFIYGRYADGTDVYGPQEKLLEPTAEDKRIHQNQRGGYYDPTPNTAYTLQYELRYGVTPAIGQQPDRDSLEKKQWRMHSPRDIARITRHEVWHSVDKNAGYVTRWPDFVAAYNQDVAAMGGPEQLKQQGYGYYIQSDRPGRGPSEVFAEVGAGLNGGGVRGTEIMELFQNSARFTERFQRDLTSAMVLGQDYTQSFLRFGRNPTVNGIGYKATLADFNAMKEADSKIAERSFLVTIMLGHIAVAYGRRDGKLGLDSPLVKKFRDAFDPPKQGAGPDALLTPAQAQQVFAFSMQALHVLKTATGIDSGAYNGSDPAVRQGFHVMRETAANYFGQVEPQRSPTADRMMGAIAESTADMMLGIQQSRYAETQLRERGQLIWLPGDDGRGMIKTSYYQSATNSYHNLSVYAGSVGDRPAHILAAQDVEALNTPMLALMQEAGQEKVVPMFIYAAGTGRQTGWEMAQGGVGPSYAGFVPSYRMSPTSQALFRLTQERLAQFGPAHVTYCDPRHLANPAENAIKGPVKPALRGLTPNGNRAASPRSVPAYKLPRSAQHLTGKVNGVN